MRKLFEEPSYVVFSNRFLMNLQIAYNVCVCVCVCV